MKNPIKYHVLIVLFKWAKAKKETPGCFIDFGDWAASDLQKMGCESRPLP